MSSNNPLVPNLLALVSRLTLQSTRFYQTMEVTGLGPASLQSGLSKIKKLYFGGVTIIFIYFSLNVKNTFTRAQNENTRAQPQKRLDPVRPIKNQSNPVQSYPTQPSSLPSPKTRPDWKRTRLSNPGPVISVFQFDWVFGMVK